MLICAWILAILVYFEIKITFRLDFLLFFTSTGHDSTADEKGAAALLTVQLDGKW